MSYRIGAEHAVVFRALRSIYEYSVSELALACWCTSTTINNIENLVMEKGKNKGVLLAMCEQYEITLEQLEQLAAYVREIGIVDFHKNIRRGFVKLLLEQAHATK